MQESAKSAPPRPGRRSAFAPDVKDLALKILADYSQRTGRKWHRIRQEIIEVTGVEVTESRPLLTRQNLESWARRDNELGDAKFALVYAFLTHPDTLARPEFARAADLVGYGTVERIGTALADFYSSLDTSAYIKRTPFGRRLSAASINRRMDRLGGIYVGEHQGRDVCLSLERFRNDAFFIAHFFSWPASVAQHADDWNIDRFSGFCTVGNMMKLHLRGVVRPVVQTPLVIPRFAPEENRVEYYYVVTHELIYKTTEYVVQKTFTAFERHLPFVDPMQYSFLIKPSSDESLKKFIDNFRWRIPV